MSLFPRLSSRLVSRWLAKSRTSATHSSAPCTPGYRPNSAANSHSASSSCDSPLGVSMSPPSWLSPSGASRLPKPSRQRLLLWLLSRRRQSRRASTSQSRRRPLLPSVTRLYLWWSPRRLRPRLRLKPTCRGHLPCQSLHSTRHTHSPQIRTTLLPRCALTRAPPRATATATTAATKQRL